MSTLPHEATSITGSDKPLPNLLLDHPGADTILRSHDFFYFRVPKVYILNCSPVLGEHIRRTLDSSATGNANTEESLPVVHLHESGEILRCLFTFIFPVIPILPSTPDGIMRLLYVAQKYQMETILTHIRVRIARHHPLHTSLERALRFYSLAQKYGLLPEALQTARTILLKQSMTIEDLDEYLDIMSGASLYELWTYHQRVQAILASDLTEFRMSGVHGTITGVRCTELSASQIPSWLDRYIGSIEKSLKLFDLVEFNAAMARHLENGGPCECASITSQIIREFWEALTSTVDASFEKAKSALALIHYRPDFEAQVSPASSSPEPLDVPDADLIIRSSDNVLFRVHKPVLAMTSPFFKDLLSLPQPYDSESVDGLPVVELPEGSELLNSLISLLYPIPTVRPNSYEKVLYLLATCQKYDMDSVQSCIRAKVKLGEFPALNGTDPFPAYAIASASGLIPEMENAAGQSLDHPMTFEALGEGLRLFEGLALRDLASFRKRCRDIYVACLDSFIEVKLGRWVGCSKFTSRVPSSRPILSTFLKALFLKTKKDLILQKFTDPLDIHARIRREFFSAFIRNHPNCNFCLAVHTTFCTELDNELAQERNKLIS